MIEVQSRICVSDTLFSQSTFEMIWPLVQQHSNIIYAYLLILIIDGILSAGEEEKKFSHFVEFSKVFKLFSAHSSTQTFESKLWLERLSCQLWKFNWKLLFPMYRLQTVEANSLQMPVSKSDSRLVRIWIPKFWIRMFRSRKLRAPQIGPVNWNVTCLLICGNRNGNFARFICRLHTRRFSEYSRHIQKFKISQKFHKINAFVLARQPIGLRGVGVLIIFIF